ncbi:cytochrome P450 [Phyllosticta citriasiana]|uniref:Cytochrome P450 n=1 Tax=Phyllosticta citriasiana TaxID=595635 RepID=A0ABR1KLB0_9PEZI
MWNLHVGDMVCQRDYVKAVKSQLKFSLPSMTTYIADQTDLAIAERIAPPPNFTCWRTVIFWNATLDIIHPVTAAIRVGPELAAVPTYIHHARGYTEEETSFNANDNSSENFAMLDGLLKNAEHSTGEISFARILILSILGYPEYLEPLRTEIETASKECDGWNNEAAARMPKLDSLLRETLRLSPPTAFTPQRKVDVEIYLSNGEVVKAGTLIGFPTLAIHRGAEYYDRPLEFDPLHFYDMLTDTIKVSFGYGTQTCPGWFLATETSKIVLAKFIVDYEISFTLKRIGKPVDWPIGGQIMPSIDTYASSGQRKH